MGKRNARKPRNILAIRKILGWGRIISDIKKPACGRRYCLAVALFCWSARRFLFLSPHLSPHCANACAYPFRLVAGVVNVCGHAVELPLGCDFEYVAVCRLVIRDINPWLHDNPLSSHKGIPPNGTDRQHQHPAW